MNHPPLAAGHIDALHQVHAQGALLLESGATILDYRQSFVTHGTLDGARSNAVLVCASLTGTHHRLDFLVGPGKALDPARWFVVATDPIGNGLSTSPSNSTAQPAMQFPEYTLRDMVSAQHRLLTEHLGLTSVHAVAGASGFRGCPVSQPGDRRVPRGLTYSRRTLCDSAPTPSCTDMDA